MSQSQAQALNNHVAAFGFFKTSNVIRDLYNAGTITLSQARAALRFLRRAQVNQLGVCSAFLWRV